jgi:multiple sugar transport system substrate-binding protein
MARLSRRNFLKMAGISGATLASSGLSPFMMQLIAQELVNISFGGWGGVAEDEGVRAAIEIFQQEMPGIAVEWRHIPDAAEFGRTLLTDLAAGTAPDTAFILADQYETLRANGALLDITDLIKEDPVLGAEDYFLQPQEAFRCADADGRWHGIGSTWVTPHIYYNADLLADEGITPPGFQDDQIWDWDTFVANAKQLTVDSAGKHPDDAGFNADDIQRYGVDWPLWWIPIASAVHSNGGQLFTDDGLVGLDTPEALEALQRLSDLIYVHHVAPRTATLTDLGMNNTQMVDSGRLAMAVEGSWALSWMNASTMQVGMGTGALPKMTQPAAIMQAHFHSVLASTQHQEEAWQWVRFLATPFYQQHFAKIGLWIPNQTAMLTEEGLAGWITEGIHPDNYKELPIDYLPKHGVAVRLPAGWIEAQNDYIVPAFDALAAGTPAADVFPDAVAAANDVLSAAKS